MISIRYVRGTRGNISSFIYLLASKTSQAITVRHIMSLSFLRSHSLSFFLWPVIKRSKGYFQRRAAVAGPVPSSVGRSIPPRRPGHTPALSEPEQRRTVTSPLLVVGVSKSLLFRCLGAGAPHRAGSPARLPALSIARRGAEPRAPLGSPGPWLLSAAGSCRRCHPEAPEQI